jgi:glycosyltransferase involved in cell wall biosynthesis
VSGIWFERVIIVNDWTYSSTWFLFFIARFSGKKVWVRADNPVSQEYKKSKKIVAVKKLVLQNILFKFLIDKCLYCGKQSREFFKFYGVPERKLLATPHAVHNDYFQAASVHDKSELTKIKIKYSIPPEKKVILFVGKYIPEKRPVDLLEAFAKLSSNGYCLVMVGEGPMRPEIERRIAEHKLQHVYLTGFINQSEIPLYYSIADVFVLSSGSETWGLAVNEAMNFAKPVIVSDACGCSEDLVVHGENGFVYETGNTEQLAGYLKKILEDDKLREKAGERSKEIVNSYSIGNIIANIQTALNS